MKRFLLVCIAGLSLAVSGLAQFEPGGSAPLQVRQKIYRVSLLDGTTLLTRNSPDDANIVQQLESWLSTGKASLVSDLATSLLPGERASLSEGRKIWLPTERDQDFDRLFLTPTSSLPSMVGTTLTVNMPDNRLGGPLGWVAAFVEKDPLLVKWPASWLGNREAIHGWVDWYDTYTESLITAHQVTAGVPTVVGALPSALHVWSETPSNAASPQMDIIVAEAIAPTRVENTPSPHQRVLFTGIVIPSNQALSLLERHDPSQDAELYQTLLEQAAIGKAQLRFCTASSYQENTRIAAASGRNHEFPTEMPSIPSAWERRMVGTRLECDPGGDLGANLFIEHHIATPRRQIWPLGIGEPELVMWEPAFRRLELACAPRLEPGAIRLVGMMKVPSVMLGEGLTAGSLFVFAHVSDAPSEPARKRVLADPFAPADDVAPSVSDIVVSPPRLNIYIQLHVFEVSASEVAQWQPAPKDAFTDSDTKRFQDLTKRTLAGTARLAGHGMLTTLSGYRGTVSMAEEVMSATEYDPPRKKAPHRMRPTALNILPTGTLLEVDPVMRDIAKQSSALVDFSYSITHSTALPQEPELNVAIKSVGISGTGPVPEAKQFDVLWKGQTTLVSGAPKCLGAMIDPASKNSKILVAFLSANIESQ